MQPFLDAHPRLVHALPRAELAELPTPLRRLERLGQRIGVPDLYLKDDGASSRRYGGNKVRKLELLLGRARAEGAEEVMTFGYAGSNHAAATAVHASALGMRSISMLMPQENAAYLRTNLLVSAAVGAELHEHDGRRGVMAGAVAELLRHRLLRGRMPFRIDPGGSSALGTVGFVAAAYELLEQARAAGLPMPATVYVAAGSMGSSVGLALGFAMQNVATRVVAVRVTDASYVNVERARGLWNATARLLHEADASIAAVPFEEQRLEIVSEFFGGTYARPTAAGIQAQELSAELEGVGLDVSYTGKAMSALIAHAGQGRCVAGPTVFWQTFNSADLSTLAAQASPQDLPQRLRRYFA